MYNTLIDNTTDFKLFKYIQQLIGNEQCNHIRIATGYWDLPGMVLIFNELKSFFERGGKLDLMIGQEPMLRAYQMRTDIPKEEIFPDFYIKRDINQLTDKYQPSFSCCWTTLTLIMKSLLKSKYEYSDKEITNSFCTPNAIYFWAQVSLTAL